MRIFCPNFNSLAKTKLVFHCNGLNFAQKHFVQRWRVPFFCFSFFFCFFFLSCIIFSVSLCCDTGILYCPWILRIAYMQLVPLCTKIMAGSFFSFSFFFHLYVMSNTLYKDHGEFLFLFFSILYHHSQLPVSELPMPWGQFLLSQRHSLYLRITCTRGQQQKEWWDFLHNSDFSIFLVLVSHYAVIRVLFTVLESFVLQHLLKSYTSKVNKTL